MLITEDSAPFWAEDGELSPWLSREPSAWTYSSADRLGSYRTEYSRRYLVATGRPTWIYGLFTRHSNCAKRRGGYVSNMCYASDAVDECHGAYVFAVTSLRVVLANGGYETFFSPFFSSWFCSPFFLSFPETFGTQVLDIPYLDIAEQYCTSERLDVGGFFRYCTTSLRSALFHGRKSLQMALPCRSVVLSRQHWTTIGYGTQVEMPPGGGQADSEATQNIGRLRCRPADV